MIIRLDRETEYKGDVRMRDVFSKVHYLLIALLLVGLTGCGANVTHQSEVAGATELTAKLTGLSLAADVRQINFQVAGPNIPTAQRTFVKGGDGLIHVEPFSVYPGDNLIVMARAYDSSNTLIYEGIQPGFTIRAGVPASVTLTMISPSEKAADKVCIGCHEGTFDAAGQNLVSDFKLSGHYTDTSFGSWTNDYDKYGIKGTGCAGCHGPRHNDVSPSTSGRCIQCHDNMSDKPCIPGLM